MCGQKQKMHENKSTQAVQKALCVHDCAHIISLEPQRLPLARVCEKSPKSGAENPVIFFLFFRGSSQHAREMAWKQDDKIQMQL